jgi:hypothetical protein
VPAPERDTLRPGLSGLVVVPHAFAPRHGSRGAAVVFQLSERATVDVTFKRLVRTRRGRRWADVPGSLHTVAGPGPARIVFGGFVDRRRLARGDYALRATAVDGAGNRSRAVSDRFRVSA